MMDTGCTVQVVIKGTGTYKKKQEKNSSTGPTTELEELFHWMTEKKSFIYLTNIY